MGRFALALCLLVACGAHGDRGPAWPKRADAEVDGGESLAPRTASVVAAVEAEKKEAKTEDKPDAKPDDAKAEDKPDAEKVTPTTTAPDDVIIIDDIIIEIED